MPLSPAQSKLNHRIGYLAPIAYMVGGVAVLAMPFFVDGPKDLEGLILLLLFGLGLLGWGIFSLWRHSKLDPTTPVHTIDDLPVDQRVRTLRRMILIVPITFTPLAAFVAYDLAQVEYGGATSVRVWAPVAFLYNKFGFLACTRFRRHQVWCDNGTGGKSCRDESLHGTSSLRLCA
jgi:hypothetical protein